MSVLIVATARESSLPWNTWLEENTVNQKIQPMAGLFYSCPICSLCHANDEWKAMTNGKNATTEPCLHEQAGIESDVVGENVKMLIIFVKLFEFWASDIHDIRPSVLRSETKNSPTPTNTHTLYTHWQRIPSTTQTICPATPCHETPDWMIEKKITWLSICHCNWLVH